MLRAGSVSVVGEKPTEVSGLTEVIQLEEEHEALTLKIVQKKSGAYELQGFSIKTLRALEDWHRTRQLPRTWRLSKDGSRLVLT